MYYSVQESSLPIKLFRNEYECDSWEEAIEFILEDAYSEEDSIVYHSPSIDADRAARVFTVTWNGKEETIVVYQFKGKWTPFPNPDLNDCYRLIFSLSGFNRVQNLELRAIVWQDDGIWRAGIQPGGFLKPSYIYRWDDVVSDSLADIKAKVEDLCCLPARDDRYPEINYP